MKRWVGKFRCANGHEWEQPSGPDVMCPVCHCIRPIKWLNYAELARIAGTRIEIQAVD